MVEAGAQYVVSSVKNFSLLYSLVCWEEKKKEQKMKGLAGITHEISTEIYQRSRPLKNKVLQYLLLTLTSGTSYRVPSAILCSCSAATHSRRVSLTVNKHKTVHKGTNLGRHVDSHLVQ